MNESFLRLVETNITKYGFHITMVSSSTVPRFAYSIGLYNTLGFELIFAGGIYFMQDEGLQIINAAVESLKKEDSNKKAFTVANWGAFSIIEADNSWGNLMTLGVFDYYKGGYVPVHQVIPPAEFYTLDVPEMSKEYVSSSDPVWKWLEDDWDLPVSEASQVITDIAALQGLPIKEVMRWEDDYWEMFTKPPSEISKRENRVIPLATILGIDKSLKIATTLEIEKGVWRDSGQHDWVPWG